MSRRNRRYKGVGYYMRRIFVAIVFVGAIIFFAPFCYEKMQKLPIEQILNSSVLKDRKFAASVQQINNDNLSAYLLEEHSNPIVAISFAFQKSGIAYENDEKSGLTAVLAEMLTAGGGKYNTQEFKDLCAEYGIKIGFNAGMDDFNGYLQFPREYQAMAVELFKSALLHPLMPEDYFELIKSQHLIALKMQQEHPESVLADNFKRFIFEGHPYERNLLGTKKGIQNLIIDDLKDYMKSNLAQDNLLIGIAGDISTDEAKQLLSQMFDELPERNNDEMLSRITIETRGKELSVSRKTAQVIASFAVAGTYRDSVDFYPLYLANYIFGGAGLTSRLNKEIREKEGLTYGIYTYLAISDAAALLQGGFSATADNFAKAKDLLSEQWQMMAQNGVSEDELTEAKKSLISSYNLRFADIDGIADMLLAMQKYKLGSDFLDKRNDYINEVELSEVNAAARKYFKQIPDFVYIGVDDVKEKK